MKTIFHKILATTALCLTAVGGILYASPVTSASETDAAEEAEWRRERSAVAQYYKPLLIQWVQYYQQLLALSRGIHDKASADAAAEPWLNAYVDLHRRLGEFNLVFISPTEEEEAAAKAEVSATHGNHDKLEQELDDERARLKEAYYFNSEQLARVLADDPTAAYPCVPATPEVAQLFEDYYKKWLIAFLGENCLSGGPGHSPETAWIIVPTPGNEKAIERYITRKARLNYSPGMLEADGFRFNLTSSGRQRMEDGTYLFHIYRVIPNSSTSAYQLKQYFRIETVTHEKPSVKSETEILSIAAREFGHDMKGYTARYEVPYYYVELTDFDEPMTLGGGPALKINAYTGAIEERYFTE